MINPDIIERCALTDQIVAQLTASLGRLSHEFRSFIARDVPQAAQQAFRRPARLRPASILRGLKQLERELHLRIDRAEIPDDLWPALGVAEEFEIDELLSSPAHLAEMLASAIAEYECMPETN